jgi:hypothetical protein
MATNRQEETFKLAQPDGTTKIYTLVPFVTPDDVMVLSAKASAGEIKFGLEYVSPATKAVRDHMILTRVTNRS